MSLKLQLRYQSRYFLNFLRSLTLPSWLAGATARFVMLSLIVVLGVGYVLQTSGLSAGGYVIHNLENQVSAAQSDIQKLDNEVAAAQSLTNVQKRLTDIKMVPLANIKYISVDAAMAKR